MDQDFTSDTYFPFFALPKLYEALVYKPLYFSSNGFKEALRSNVIFQNYFSNFDFKNHFIDQIKNLLCLISKKDAKLAKLVKLKRGYDWRSVRSVLGLWGGVH